MTEPLDVATVEVRDLIDHLRVTHGRVSRMWRRPDGCATCGVDWPCPVSKLLDALAATTVPTTKAGLGLAELIDIHRAWHGNPRYRHEDDDPCPLAPTTAPATEPECLHPGCGLPERLHGAPPGEPPNPTRSTHRFRAGERGWTCSAIWNGCVCGRAPHDDDRHVWLNTLDRKRAVDPARYPAVEPSRERDGLREAAVRLAFAVARKHGLTAELYDMADRVRITAGALQDEAAALTEPQEKA